MATDSRANRQSAIDYSSDSSNDLSGSSITSAQTDVVVGKPIGLSDLLSDDSKLALPRASQGYDGPTRSALGHAGDPIKILILGDSYTTKSSPLFAALDRELDFSGYDVKLVTKAKNGAFLSDGAGQLSAGLKAFKGVDAVMVMLGSNDSQAGRLIDRAEQNLDSLLGKLDAKGLPALVAGTYGDWPVQGQGYGSSTDQSRFEAIFGRQANKHGDILYDHILDGAYDVGGRTFDGQHPNSDGANVIASNMSSALDELVFRAATE